MPSDSGSSFLTLRFAPPPTTRYAVGAGALALILLLWWLATLGASPEDRLISPIILPSPVEVFGSLPSLVNDRALIASIFATLRRVIIGFGIAVLIGVPLGMAAGSWRVIEAAGAPLALFGRNLPVAA